MIRELTIVTSIGVKRYKLGDECGEYNIALIRKDHIYITGDPFDHYCGYDDKGKMLFSVNCLVPCEIEYL